MLGTFIGVLPSVPRDAHEQLTGTTHHPYWDLACLLEDDFDLGVDAARVRWTENALRRVVPLLLSVT